MDTRVL
jgi:hypothetical protein